MKKQRFLKNVLLSHYYYVSVILLENLKENFGGLSSKSSVLLKLYVD